MCNDYVTIKIYFYSIAKESIRAITNMLESGKNI